MEHHAVRTLPGVWKGGLVSLTLALFALMFSGASAYAATQIEESWINGTGAVTYTGAAQDPITIKDPNLPYQTLTKYQAGNSYYEHFFAYKVDYTGDNTNAGKVKFTVTGGADLGSFNKNYTGTVSGTFKIKAADLDDATVSFPSDVASQYAKTGAAIKPVPQVTLDNGATYLPESDYTVTYLDADGNVVDPVEPGTYTVEVEAASKNVTGSNESLTFTILDQASDLTQLGAQVADIDDQTYSGQAIEPGVTVTLSDGTTLKQGTDYTVEYANNIDAGTATATVTGTGVYAGTLTKSFTINPLNISGDLVSLTDAAQYSAYPFNGTTAEPKVQVIAWTAGYDYSTWTYRDAGPAISADNYTVSYANNDAVWLADNIKGWWSDYANTTFDANKQPTVTITGKGNLQGTATVTFNITPQADISKASIRNAPEVTFDGEAHALSPSDFGTKFTTLTQNGSAADCAYGLEGKEGIAYDVSYKDADGNAIDADKIVNAGTYTMVLTGKESGGFTGTKEVNFTIQPAAFSDVTVADVDENGRYQDTVVLNDGESAATPGFDLTLGEGDDAYTLIEGTDYTISYAGNTKAGNARATITPTGNFTGDPQVVTFSIVDSAQVQAQNSLNQAIETAQAIEQGTKSTAAYNTLQAAIDAAQDAADATDVDKLQQAQSTLEDAVKAFNDSADITKVDAQLYLSGTYGTDDQSASHAAQYFSDTVEISADGDAYDVDIALTEAAGNMVPKLRIGATDGEGELTAMGNGIFRAKLTADELGKAINLGMYVSVTMNGQVVHEGWQQADLVLIDAAATKVVDRIADLPATDELTLEDAGAVKKAQTKYDELSAIQQALVTNAATLTSDQAQIAQLRETAQADNQKALSEAKAQGKAEQAAADKAAAQKAAAQAAAKAAKAKKQATVTVNVKTVTASAIAKAVKKAGSSKAKVTTIVLGSKVKAVKAKALAKYAKVKTITVKSKKLTKKGVKNALKGSKVTTVKVSVSGKAKTNKKYVKTYKTYFAKANSGKKVTVKAA